MAIKFSQAIFFAFAATGEGISGSDRIFIEFARHWSSQIPIRLYTSPAGARMSQQLLSPWPSGLAIHLAGTDRFRFPFIIDYVYKLIIALKLALTLSSPPPSSLIYSCSEFFMDSLPAFILKLRFPYIYWAAAWYQTAPSPWRGFSGGRYRLRALIYWLMQLPIKPLIGYFADWVMVNNQSEIKIFSKSRKAKPVVVLGAVNLLPLLEFQRRHPLVDPKYAGVFQGRFHPQKGVVELVEIWRLVVNRLPNAQLLMIGDGPLMSEVKHKISELKLTNNITLAGYIFDGSDKYSLFSRSQIVVHPSYYDSGGMASAEAMSFNLPGVAYKLPAYRDYYPQGLIQVPLGDQSAFASVIIDLLTHPVKRQKLGRQAGRMIRQTWSWSARAAQVILALNQTAAL